MCYVSNKIMYSESCNSSACKAGIAVSDIMLGPRILVCNTSPQTLHFLYYMWFSA